MNSLSSSDDRDDVGLSTYEASATASSKRDKAARINFLSDFCTIKNLLRLVLGPNVVEDDISRWFSQGFVFAGLPRFGLTQGAGGPCGVLAAVQVVVLSQPV